MTLSIDQLLTWLLLYGYPVLFGGVLVGSLGVPIPTDLLLVAAGGFAAEGDLELATVLGLVFTGAVLGDCVVYGVVRFVGAEAVHRHGARVGLGRERLAAAEAKLGKWLGPGVFVTRWLLTPLSLPTTVLAGLAEYPPLAYLAWVLGGEILWTSVYVGIGYAFGAAWPSLLDTVQDSAGLVAGVGITVVALVLLFMLRPRRAARGAV